MTCLAVCLGHPHMHAGEFTLGTLRLKRKLASPISPCEFALLVNSPLLPKRWEFLISFCQAKLVEPRWGVDCDFDKSPMLTSIFSYDAP